MQYYKYESEYTHFKRSLIMRKNFKLIILLSLAFCLGWKVNSNELPIVYKDSKIKIIAIKKPQNKEIMEIIKYNFEIRNPLVNLKKLYFENGNFLYVANNSKVIDRFSSLIVKEEENESFLEIIINPFAPMTPEMKVVKENIIEIFSDYPDLLEIIEQNY